MSRPPCACCLPACLGWSSNFLEFRYPGMDERSRSRRARALFGFVAGSRGRDVTGIDYETWCSYCFQDEPLLLTYTCALQQARRQSVYLLCTGQHLV